jgi:hypothetical protein
LWRSTNKWRTVIAEAKKHTYCANIQIHDEPALFDGLGRSEPPIGIIPHLPKETRHLVLKVPETYTTRREAIDVNLVAAMLELLTKVVSFPIARPKVLTNLKCFSEITVFPSHVVYSIHVSDMPKLRMKSMAVSLVSDIALSS